MDNALFKGKWDVCVINDTIHVDQTPRRRNDLGNGTWGEIDWLVSHLGYRIKFHRRYSRLYFDVFNTLRM